jgi:endoglucanase
MRLDKTMVCVGLVGALAASAVQGKPAGEWPEWDEFVERFVQADGRVIDVTFDRKSTSEGQSYALFFALVANQRRQFDQILQWTSDNLASGQLGAKLPGWLWGLREDGSWGLKDRNSASDADLFIAYALFEAARLWNAPAYAEQARLLLDQIRRLEITQAGAAGTLLLPGPVGFKLDHGRHRIDPSYMPGFMFRYFAVIDPAGPWQAVWDGYLRLAPQIFRAGVAPDLVVVDAAGRVLPDSETEQPVGSYDAIRVYLWAGMSGRNSESLRKLLMPFAALTRQLGAPPEKVHPGSGVARASDYSPIGYSGALLPFLSAINDAPGVARQSGRLRDDASSSRNGRHPNYYDQVLILFGKGWLDGQYRFDEQGRLQPRWLR